MVKLLKGLKLYTIFNCPGESVAPDPCIVQASTVYSSPTYTQFSKVDLLFTNANFSAAPNLFQLDSLAIVGEVGLVLYTILNQVRQYVGKQILPSLWVVAKAVPYCLLLATNRGTCRNHTGSHRAYI